ncbi:dethiobiotin synthase [Desulforhopalus sp. IMCC35007]|uniref:dethiobiotin synthase n=1 Tax=Desulforhopalus sp. IMCC35007 TaxID=2569543 RepID=UPI0010AE9A5E|nr:dethiobiotin synthase [Desulforhopalus sp. IMCC35007]TKB09332.1 ATP-dependent dethiobiotin synthetase BioD [Desulforhopalus sp. IMCC35007]
MIKEKILCVTGIDTDIGKTVVTGLVARAYKKKGISVITQKMAQTGCQGMSEDIIAHRDLMEMELQPEDYDATTCPYVFKTPCSPHLAAHIEGVTIDCDVIRRASQKLLQRYDLVILEGAGGISVPITADFTFLDYLQRESIPIIIVTSPRLGSINHTLNILEIAKYRCLAVKALVYNHHQKADGRIVKDSREIFNRYLKKYGYVCPVIDIYPLTNNPLKDFDISALSGEDEQ